MTAPSVSLAWQQARAGRPARAKQARTPLLLVLVAWVGRHLPTWGKARSAIVQTAAFASLTYAAFQWSTIAGFVAVGVSLLILDALTEPRARR